MMNKEKTLPNIIWRFAERVGAQAVGFVVSVILARMLSPEDYGLVALVAVFITIMQVFVDSGFGNALIQKKEADNLDFSSVFWFNVVICLVLYLLLFAFAPLIASFYGNSELILILRILGIQVIISSVKNVQQAYVSRTMQFKRFFFATIGGTIGAAVIGIWMAKKGYGVWALVAQQILNVFVDTVILWITVKWRPKLIFSIDRLKGLFDYGWKILVAALLGNGYISLRQLIIGKVYTPSDLAFYNKGDRFPNMLVVNIDASIGSVMLPVMSKEQDNIQHVKSITRRAIKASTYLIAPLMIGLACVGRNLVELLLTSKWLPCVPYMQIICFSYILYPINTANLNAMLALGRSDKYLKLEIIKKTIGITAILLTMRISVFAMAIAVLVSSFISTIVNAAPNKKILEYSYIEQIRDILPELMLSVLMGCAAYAVSFFNLHSGITLLLQILVGISIYIGASILFKYESYEYLKNKFLELLSRTMHRDNSMAS